MGEKKIAVLIFFLGLVAYTVGLSGLEFTKIDIRYALFISEMKQYGIGLFPTLYGKPYTDYNSAGVFLMYLASLGGDYVNMFTAVLPGAIISSFTLVLTYLIGARISRQLGLYAVMLTFFSVTYMAIARSPSLDVYVVLASTLSFYLVYISDIDKGNKRLFLVPLCFIFGFVFRGMLGLMIPSAVVFGYYLVNGKWKRCFTFAFVSAVLAIVCSVIFLFLSYIDGGKELLQCMLYNQILDRVRSNDYCLYYFLDGLGIYALTFPLGMIALLCYLKKMFKAFGDSRDKTMHFIISVSVWLIITLVLMSIPGAKNPRYVVSMIPAAALLGATIFINPYNFLSFNCFKKFFFLVCKIAPFLTLIAFIGGLITLKFLKIHVPFYTVITLIVLIVLSISMIYCVKRLKEENLSSALFIIGTLVMIVVQVLLVDPINQRAEGSKDFVSKVEALREKNNSAIWFFDFGPDGDEMKYLVNIPKDKRFIPNFIDPFVANISVDAPIQNRVADYKQNIVDAVIKMFPETTKKFPRIEPRYNVFGFGVFKTLPDNTIYICQNKDFERRLSPEMRSQFEIVLSGQMGHMKCIAFRKKS